MSTYIKRLERVKKALDRTEESLSPSYEPAQHSAQLTTSHYKNCQGQECVSLVESLSLNLSHLKSQAHRMTFMTQEIESVLKKS